jgi:hypothetical protein
MVTNMDTMFPATLGTALAGLVFMVLFIGLPFAGRKVIEDKS